MSSSAEYIDAFFLARRPEELPEGLDDSRREREGRIRRRGSTHDRKLAGRSLRTATATPRDPPTQRTVERRKTSSAPRAIGRASSPHGHPLTALLRRPRGWPKDERVPTAGDCYRFVLSSPHVDVCMTAPRSVRELEQNLAATARGPLDEDEMEFMRRFGDAVHAQRRWFM
jgi:hypothetical protein